MDTSLAPSQPPYFTPTSPFPLFHKYKQCNRLYIFYLQIYICLKSVGYGAKGLQHNPQ